MSIIKTVVSIIICSLLCGSALSGEVKRSDGCKCNPELVGDCFTIHGKLSPSNGTPSLRISVIGTKRILGVIPSEDEIIPPSLKEHLRFGTAIYGDYTVCPFTESKPGHMQMVCIEEAKNLVVESYIEGQENPRIYKIKDAGPLGCPSK
jgi:hypothetical protein